MYDDEQADIDVKIKYERNIIEYMSKPTKTNSKTHFLLHSDLYSTYNYQSLHGLILGASIKTHLSNLDGVAFNRLNYLGMGILVGKLHISAISMRARICGHLL